MTKYYVETNDEDFIIDVPKDAQVVMDNLYTKDVPVGELRVVQREIVETDNEWGVSRQFNDHVLACYQGVKACRSEQVKRLDPEVA